MSKRSKSSRSASAAHSSCPHRCLRLPWYWMLPLAAVLVCGLASFGFSYAPAALFRSSYPLEYVDAIAASSVGHDVDPHLVAAIIETESGWDPEAQSSKGACGLMQLMPETAQDMVDMGLVDGGRYDASNLTDPETNIEIGCAYLAYLLDYFHGSTEHAIAAYNAGLSHVETWSQEDTVLHNAITFPETQAYLIRVNNAWMRYRELYSQVFATDAGVGVCGNDA